MERSAWTDERLDDLAATLDTNVRLLREEVQGLREDMRREVGDLRVDFRELRADFSAWQRQIAQIGWAFAVALTGAIVALIVAAV
jgi:hypothetical protein